MISDFGKGEEHVEEQAYRGADDRGAEATGSGTQGGGRGARSGRVEAHDLRLEGEVRRNGRERGAGGQALAGREREVAQAGGGSESGQRSLAVGDPKKRLGLVARKAAIGQMREEYAFSEQRACGLLDVAVSSYRYQPRRSDEPLRTKLVELAREKPRFGFSYGKRGSTSTRFFKGVVLSFRTTTALRSRARPAGGYQSARSAVGGHAATKAEVMR